MPRLTRALFRPLLPVEQRLSAIAQAWPLDPLRPDDDYGAFLHRHIPQPSAHSASESGRPRLEAALADACAALERVCAGTASSTWPLDRRMLRPASDPRFYERLAFAREQALKGQPASRWDIFFGRDPLLAKDRASASRKTTPSVS